MACCMGMARRMALLHARKKGAAMEAARELFVNYIHRSQAFFRFHSLISSCF